MTDDLFSEALDERAAIMQHCGGMSQANAEAAAAVDVQCIRCDLFRLRDADREMVAHGFGNCARGSKWSFYGAERARSCPHFKPAGTEVVTKRQEWADKRAKP